MSAITIAELRFGVASLPVGKRRDELQYSLEKQLLPLFVGQVLSFDISAPQAYGEILAQAAGLTISTADGYIAAAANGMKMATRDVSPFAAAGVSVINL